ncbi:MAG: hypothetical protein K0R18_243 [Bacillales bacterium]|jgi:uncharacterized protein (DUF2461 family)|nr:hypothetical protein [Bacillales bacterium]
MTRLKKVADYLEELKENIEQKDIHEKKLDDQKSLYEQHPDTSFEKDKSLYTFNRLKRK